MSPVLAGGFFTAEPPGKHFIPSYHQMLFSFLFEETLTEPSGRASKNPDMGAQRCVHTVLMNCGGAFLVVTIPGWVGRWEGGGTLGVVARDTGKHPPEHRAAPTTKNDPALRVTSGRLRNPGLQGQDFSWVSGQWPLGKEPESSMGNVADRHKGAGP